MIVLILLYHGAYFLHFFCNVKKNIKFDRKSEKTFENKKIIIPNKKIFQGSTSLMTERISNQRKHLHFLVKTQWLKLVDTPNN